MATNTPLPISGKFARVRISQLSSGAAVTPTEIFVRGTWEATFGDSDEDTTNFESGGYSDQIPNINSLVVTTDGYYDAGNCPFITPLFLYHGNYLSARFYLYSPLASPLTNPYIDMPIAMVSQPVIAAEVRGKIGFKCDFKNKGIFYYPSSHVT